MCMEEVGFREATAKEKTLAKGLGCRRAMYRKHC